MKKFTFKGVLDGFRQTVQPQAARQEQEFHDQLKPEQFNLKRTFRHGFPFSPTSFAFDPVQKLIAIGDKSGFIRILGRPGVDAHAKHEGESECAVIFLVFLVNEGSLVSVTADDTIHLWNIRQKTPQVVQSLKFQRERVTCLHLPVGSKWLYVGTEKGNIHVVNVTTFALSGYIINWNKAMEVVRTSHPGAVIALCDNPLDANKLLMAFECGLIVLWDLKAKCAEIRWQSPEPVKSIAWHYEGKYFISSHTDGSVCTWPTRPTQKPQSLVLPHAKVGKDGVIEKCKAIYKIDLKSTQMGETFTIFSGGMSSEKSSKTNCITVMVGKTTTVLEMEHAVVDFITLCENPWTCETQEPYAIAVLLQYDLVLIDLLTPGFPCFESPYPMDLHESPVTCCTYLTDCPSDLVPAFYSVGRTTTNKKIGFSEREWPICGGEWSPASCSYSEIVITGHQDGSLKFWDSGAGTLQILYKLKTAKIFEKPKTVHSDNGIENPLAIQLIYLCSESRRLCVAGSSGQVMLFKFRKVESTSDVLVLDIPILYENFEDIYGTSPECDFIPHQVQKTESSESDKTECSLRVKTGAQRKPPGFQAQIICLTSGPNRRNVQITSLCINSSYGLMAYGTEYGLVIVDIIQKICLMSVACPDLYGAHDPYSRTPKSPKRIENKEEQSRSPSSDQLNDTTSPDSPSIELIPEATEQALSSNQNQSNPSRPTSPQDDQSAVAAAAAAKSPNTEDVSIAPPNQPKELQDRRKSMSWKTFNLKRQLSKVNMKIGLNVAANDGNDGGAKNTAVFYTQKECSPEESVTPSSPNKDIQPSLECREDMFDMCMLSSLDGGGQPDENNECPAVKSDDSKAAAKDEADEPDRVAPTKRVEFEQTTGEGQTSRPSNLPLAVDDGGPPPIKPQRQKFKEKRDQRLLSVPNIKYQMRDIRMRANKNDASPSMSGNIAKKMPSEQSRINGGTSAYACNSGNKVVVSGSPSERRAQSDANETSTTDSGNNNGCTGGAGSAAPAGGAAAAGASSSSSTSGSGGAMAISSKSAIINQEQLSRASPPTSSSLAGEYAGAVANAAAAAEASSPGAMGNANVALSDMGTPMAQQQQQQLQQQQSLQQQHHQPVQQYSVTSETFVKTKSQDKLDGSFSRSRSSSVSSIDMSSSESVTCLALIESYVKKNDISTLVPTLWIGTSFGSILTLLITIPERDVRKSQPVLVTINGGPIVRLKGSITSMSFLDAFGTIMPYTSEPWRDESRDGKKERTPTKSFSRTSPTFTQTTANTIPSSTGGNISSSSTSTSGVSGSISTGLDTLTDRQYIVVASEKQTKVFDIVNQCCINRIQLAEMDFAVKAEIITMKDGTCLATYLSNGHLMVHSLPSLKVLLDTDFLPLMELSFQTKCKQGIVDPMLSIWGQQIIVHEDTTQISKVFCFSHKGHGLYMASPTEIQKFTISSEFCQFIVEMMGELFTTQEMPEQPKESFFKGLFGGGSKSLDREELFGEQSGKANRSVAKHIPGPNLDQLGQRASTAASEISRAHQLAMERGDKLNLLEERAERMSNQAQDFSGSAHQLMLKYKDKKWYQL